MKDKKYLIIVGIFVVAIIFSLPIKVKLRGELFAIFLFLFKSNVHGLLLRFMLTGKREIFHLQRETVCWG